MNTKTYVGIIVFLFILLLLGWSTTLFAFCAGAVGGIIGYQLYESEILTNLATIGGTDATLNIKGVYASAPIFLIEKPNLKTFKGDLKKENPKERQIEIPNDPNIPREKNVPEYPINVVVPCYDRENVIGTPLDVVLVRKMSSDKNMLIVAPNETVLNQKYYLELAPQYTKRDENQSIIGVYALKVKDGDSIKQDTAQATEKHTRLLELLAKVLNKIWCGKIPKGVELLGATKHSSTVPDQGPLAILSHVMGSNGQPRMKMHTLAGADFIRGDDKIRGDVVVNYDDESITMPVVEKHYPTKDEISRMPLLQTIENLSENSKLVIVMQDYITGAIAEGDVLPKNVIYIGQALRDDSSKKLFLNAFINPRAYDSILRLLENLN